MNQRYTRLPMRPHEIRTGLALGSSDRPTDKTNPRIQFQDKSFEPKRWKRFKAPARRMCHSYQRHSASLHHAAAWTGYVIPCEPLVEPRLNLQRRSSNERPVYDQRGSRMPLSRVQVLRSNEWSRVNRLAFDLPLLNGLTA